MTVEIAVTCPRCGETFPLTDALSHRARELLLAPERDSLRAQAFREVATRIEVLERELAEQEAARREHELELIRRERELARRERDRDLERERERADIERAAEESVAQRYQAQINQKDSQLQRVSAELESLRQRASTGSAQQAGVEAQKLLGDRLREMFPDDEVTVVRQGQHGADVEHEVRTGSGRLLGKILWESKNAAAWSDAWTDKIRRDCEEAAADVGVIVSRALPRGVGGMTLLKDVVVVAPEYVSHVGPLLRLQIQQEARHRLAASAEKGTADRVLEYLTTGGFVPHLVRAVEAAASLQDGIARERRLAEQRWQKQLKQAELVIHELAGIAVDLDAQGARLPAIPALELPALPETVC